MTTSAFSRPLISSPLSSVPETSTPLAATKRVVPKRNTSFPSSRALRPFPTISHAFQPTASSNKKPPKLIEPPKDHKVIFMLDLTQAEFSRQE